MLGRGEWRSKVERSRSSCGGDDGCVVKKEKKKKKDKATKTGCKKTPVTIGRVYGFLASVTCLLTLFTFLTHGDTTEEHRSAQRRPGQEVQSRAYKNGLGYSCLRATTAAAAAAGQDVAHETHTPLRLTVGTLLHLSDHVM